MKVIYQFYNEWTLEQVFALKQFGISVDQSYSSVEITEESSNYDLLLQLNAWNVTRFYWPVYDKKDYLNRQRFVYSGSWSNGYPMPDHNNQYLAATFDLTNYCPECGTGAIQNHPFRLKQRPKWGNKMIFDLNWVPDELFVKKELYNTFFLKLGIESKPVVVNKTGEVIDDTVQLDLPVTKSLLNLGKHDYTICPHCNRIKYASVAKGFFPNFTDKNHPSEIFKSQELFGSGGASHRKIFITANLWRELKGLGVRLNLWPVQ